jgi:alcohol dehydrogenase class IV
VAGGLGLTPNVFQGAEEHVPLGVVQAAWRAASEHDADAVVSFGGGSSIDLGKAVAFMGEHGPEAIMGDAPPADPNVGGDRAAPRIAHVAVPTTYSGVEASGCLFVSEKQEKRGVAGPGVRPDLVLADPALTLTLPWKGTGGTGLVALAHCLEALCSPSRTEWSDSLARQAARSVFSLLPVVSSTPKRVGERGEMLGAAYVAGAVSDVAGRGVHHALCTGLGGRTGVAHGAAGAILLPHVLRFLLERGSAGLAGFTESIGLDDQADAANAASDLVRDLRLPRKLREVGVFEQDLEPVASWAGQRSHEVGHDHQAFSDSDALAILRAAW